MTGAGGHTEERAGTPGPGAWTLLAAGVALVGAAAIAGSLGRGEGLGPVAALGVVLTSVVLAGPPALALVLAGAGYGRLARPLFKDSTERAAIQLGVGLAIVLSLIHGVGALGLLSPVAAIALVVIGLGLLAHQLAPAARRLAGEDIQPPPLGGWWAAIPGVAVLLVAASALPGWLWDSEFGGYDVLSYHLQLAQEWLAAGTVEPLEHNVYSFLPSYVESAFAMLGALTLAPEAVGAEGGLLAGSGWRAVSAQMLHVCLTLCAAWMVAAFVRRALTVCGVEGDRARLPASLAGVLVLATPWIVVVGSMAYNEMGVTALGAAAMLVAVEDRVRPLWRGALAGALVGVACGAKPTAILMLTPMVGVLLLGTARTRDWWVIVGGGVIAGLIALAPWLVRNWIAGGNPVFPHLAGAFGPAHWGEEQVGRYLAGHRFEGGLLEHPHYTRPQEWEGRAIPEVLVSGNHRKIAEWRRAEAEKLTRERRPDLLAAPQPVRK